MKRIVVMLLVGILAGCATQGSQGRYGNFTETLPVTYNDQMVDDTVDRLSALYPPANTRLALQQQPVDPFGAALVGKLRERGYAVMEPLPQTKQTQAKSDKVPPPAPEVDLGYVVDQIEASQYLVTVRVGSQSISRAYRAAGDTLAPDGYWIRKE